MNCRIKKTKLLLFIFMPSLLVGVTASPMVIRDNRARDLSVTPSLGRGYSLSVNTYQSVCFDRLKSTPASFDLKYKFEKLQGDDVTTEKMEGTFKGADAYLFLKRHTSQKYILKNKTKHYNHHLITTLEVNSYYSSLNEAESKISAHALDLLRKRDLLGFFSSCGTNYIRSISRLSRFLSIFTYTTEKKERDEEFEHKLRHSIRRFSLFKGKSKVEKSREKKFEEKADSYNLKIVTRSIGLEKREGANLLAFDLKSYRRSITDAFKSMQDEFSGRITSLEVVPWVENTLFQSVLNLKDDKSPEGYPLPRAMQKHILNDNAEFYLMVDRTIRLMGATIQKAISCRSQIDSLYKTNGKFLPKYLNRNVINHLTGQLMPLTELDKALSGKEIKKLRVSRELLMWGKAPAFNDGTNHCIKSLYEAGFSSINYRSVGVCRKISNRAIYKPLEVVEQYCMPMLEEQKVD